MTTTSIHQAAEWGPLVLETDIDDAVVATLQKWLPTYVHRLEHERGLAVDHIVLPRIQNITPVLNNETFPEASLPAIMVTTADMETEPLMGSGEDGTPDHYYAMWRVVISAVVRGRTKDDARRTAAMLGGSIRRLMVDHTALGGLSGDVRWSSGHVAPIMDITPEKRHLAAGMNEFVVFIDDALRAGIGPAIADPYPDPNPDDPFGDLAEVGLVDTAITGLTPTQEV